LTTTPVPQLYLRQSNLYAVRVLRSSLSHACLCHMLGRYQIQYFGRHGGKKQWAFNNPKLVLPYLNDC
jgi:hypothetical protein